MTSSSEHRTRSPRGRGGRTRAPRNSLSAELILDRALELLDSRGVDAFSMRALAEELGVGTMALYTYFRGKDELFEAARDRVLAAYRPPEAEGGWDDRLRALCLALYGFFTERPAVLRLLAEPGPRQGEFADSATATLERMLTLLREAGLGREECARSCSVLLQYTVGAGLKQIRACGGEEDVHARRLRSLGERISPETHPVLTDLVPELLAVREGAEGAEGGAAQYAFGLDLILAGLREKARRGD